MGCRQLRSGVIARHEDSPEPLDNWATSGAARRRRRQERNAATRELQTFPYPLTSLDSQVEVAAVAPPELVIIGPIVGLLIVVAYGTVAALVKCYQQGDRRWLLAIIAFWFIGIGWLIGWIYLLRSDRKHETRRPGPPQRSRQRQRTSEPVVPPPQAVRTMSADEAVEWMVEAVHAESQLHGDDFGLSEALEGLEDGGSVDPEAQVHDVCYRYER